MVRNVEHAFEIAPRRRAPYRDPRGRAARRCAITACSHAGMRDIARAAGLSTGNLYYYFRNKEELVYACQDRALDRLLEVLALAPRSRPDAAERLGALVEGHLQVVIVGRRRRCTSISTTCRAAVQEDRAEARQLRARRARPHRRRAAPGDGALRRAQAAGVRAPGRAQLGGALVSPGRRRSRRGSSTSFKEQLLRGLSVATDLIPTAADPTLRAKGAAVAAVNGEARELLVDAYKTLLEVLREDLRADRHQARLRARRVRRLRRAGRRPSPCSPAWSLAVECDGRARRDRRGDAARHRAPSAAGGFADLGAAQCGYCTPGILLAAKALLDAKPDADARPRSPRRSPAISAAAPATSRSSRRWNGGRADARRGCPRQQALRRAMRHATVERHAASSASRSAASTAAPRSPARPRSPTISSLPGMLHVQAAALDACRTRASRGIDVARAAALPGVARC